MKTLLLCLAVLGIGLSSVSLKAQDLDQEILNQAQTSLGLMFDNISRPDASAGSVAAAPSKDNPDYYFNWIRDAALTMDTVVSLYSVSIGSQQADFLKTLKDYVTFSRNTQLTPNRSGGLGEPKFNMDGSAFTGDWGRPQNDGPALRALTLIRLANLLLNQHQNDYVRLVLYDGALPSESVIKSDLEYVSHHWSEPCFDLWEEVYGHHFYTLMVERAALLNGAQLAHVMGDDAAASYYSQQASQITGTLLQFWDSNRNVLVETRDQNGGIQKSGLDVAIILAALHAKVNDGFLSVIDDKVISTGYQLMTSFRNIYAINNAYKDLGPAIGRYPEDIYNGNGTSKGNPWFLATLAYAQWTYEMRYKFIQAGQVTVTDLNKPFFQFILGNKTPLKAGTTLTQGTAPFDGLMDALDAFGDSIFRRVLFHKGGDGNLTEQFNRDSGYKQGAPNLTWSHSAFISSAAWRTAPQD